MRQRAATVRRRGRFPVEFLNLVIIFTTALLLLRAPQKERLAFRLLVTSVLLMMAIFLMATRGSWLPGFNY
jgi:hypothetical protein